MDMYIWLNFFKSTFELTVGLCDLQMAAEGLVS